MPHANHVRFRVAAGPPTWWRMRRAAAGLALHRRHRRGSMATVGTTAAGARCPPRRRRPAGRHRQRGRPADESPAEEHVDGDDPPCRGQVPGVRKQRGCRIDGRGRQREARDDDDVHAAVLPCTPAWAGGSCPPS